MSEPPIPQDDELIARLAEKARLAGLETPDLVMEVVREQSLSRDVAQELGKRPPSRTAAELVIDAYRRGEASPYLTAELLGACRDKAGYATAREILLAAPRRCSNESAGVALAKIDSHSALQDLINIMHNAPERGSREGAAYGLNALGLSEAAPAILDAVLSHKISILTGGWILGHTFPDESVVLSLLDSAERNRTKKVAANIVASCIESIPINATLDRVPALLSRPSPPLIEALERVLSDTNITMSPYSRKRIRSWLNNRSHGDRALRDASIEFSGITEDLRNRLDRFSHDETSA